MAVIGIDLGTTNSLVAHFRDGEVELIPNRNGNYLTPSVVTITDEGVYIGEIAKEKSVVLPDATASEFKRFMGTDKVYSLNGEELSSVELSALILRSLVEDAALYLEEDIEEAVISVPAYFNNHQRNATVEAAKIAGIHVEKLINEPTAAAIAYHVHDNKDETVVGIVDLGGGTYDISILDIFDEIVEVRAVAGDNYLGGQDFDEAIVKHLAEKFEIDLLNCTKEVLAKLKYLAESSKIKLSETNQVNVKFVHEEVEKEYLLTERKLEQIIEPLISKLKEPLKKAIIDSQFKADEIDEIILVGGSTRMPTVKKFVSKLFGKLPLCHLNPDEVVVRGAAITAAMKDRDEHFEDTVLTDVCPYTLGTSVIRESELGLGQIVYDPLIERNQTVPISISKTYYTAQDNQTAIGIDVYQGDAFQLEKNLKLGNLKLTVPPAPKGEVSITVRFTYDINGILEVEAHIPKTGETKKAILMNNNQLSEGEIEKKLKDIAHLKIHPREQSENANLIAQAERYYEMTLGQLRSAIGVELGNFMAILDQQNKDEIKYARKRLKEFLIYVEQMI